MNYTGARGHGELRGRARLSPSDDSATERAGGVLRGGIAREHLSQPHCTATYRSILLTFPEKLTAGRANVFDPFPVHPERRIAALESWFQSRSFVQFWRIRL